MKIISGGQTGVDRWALEIARALSVTTGGTAPKGWRTDTGSDESLRDFGLVEGKVFGYPHRTEQNVINSDATVLFGDLTSPGCRLTIRLCKKHNKPYFKNPVAEELFNLVIFYGVKVLNVAGNREKNISSDKAEVIKNTINEFLTKVKNEDI